MKRLLLGLAAAMLLAGSVWTPSRAEEVKIGYVDTARIFENYKVAQDAQKQFDRDVESWNRDLTDLKNDIAKLKQELENQSLVLSDAKRREKEAALTRKQSDYQSQVDAIWGPKGRASLRNAELVKSVVEKIKLVLETMAQKENYTLILDAAADRILYSVKSSDLTQKVLDQLNAEAPNNPTGLAPASH